MLISNILDLFHNFMMQKYEKEKKKRNFVAVILFIIKCQRF